MSVDLIQAGRLLWEAGLIHFTAGNLSVLVGDELRVTRTGSSLAMLGPGDIVSLEARDDRDDKAAGASSETPVHRALYKARPDARAVAHAHPPNAVALSFGAEALSFDDSDSLFIPRVRVLSGCPYGEGSRCVAERLPAVLGKDGVALVRGHGAFAVGKDLSECVAVLTMLEHQCRLAVLRRSLKGQV